MKDVQVFTISQFNDKLIVDKYLKTVTYHIVIGMNFFADFMQNFTDIFGGQSESYQKRLKEINHKVIQGIKKEVKKAGGNCAIDLKIDNDEISAKGKSMIMVTAIATAVKLDLSSTFDESENNLELETISRQKVKDTIELIALRNRLNNSALRDLGSILQLDRIELNENHKNLIFLSRDWIIKMISNNEEVNDWQRPINRLCELLDSTDKTKFFYDFIYQLSNLQDGNTTNSMSLITEYCIEQIRINSLTDAEKSIEFFQHENENLKMIGIKLISSIKQFYTIKDLDIYKKIVDDLKTLYPLIEDDGKFWICKCGKKENKITFDSCVSMGCMFDRRGFSRANDVIKLEPLPVYIRILEERINALDYIFNDN